MTKHNSEMESTSSVAPQPSGDTSNSEAPDAGVAAEVPETAVLPETQTTVAAEVPETAVLPETETTTENRSEAPVSAPHGFGAPVAENAPVPDPAPVSPYRKGVNMTGVVYACIVMIFAVIAGLVGFRIPFDATLFAVGACTLVAVLLIIAAFIPNRSAGRK